MNYRWVKNAVKLGSNEDRRLVLELIEEGYNAIDTEQVIRSSVHVNGDILTIKNQTFNLTKYKRIYIIGFGKVSCKAAYVLETIMGSRINDGIAIGLKPIQCEIIRSYEGTHPKPTPDNVIAAQEIVNLSEQLKEDDLVITIVSGGGSALLCWPQTECEASKVLYEAFLKTGGDIRELNTVRKHISRLKGGGLAEKLYPAHVIGLIFSDVPGNDYSVIASGPTFKDNSTVDDAMQIIKKYNLGKFELNETPKDSKYFEKIINIPLVSNEEALNAMLKLAQKKNINASILTSVLYDEPKVAVDRLAKALETSQLVLAGGEPSLMVNKTGGNGGRNTYMGMKMLAKLQPGMVFAGVASDGLDNGPYAGIIQDHETFLHAQHLKLNQQEYLDNFDCTNFYLKLGNELLETGPTEANISDLYILYRK